MSKVEDGATDSRTSLQWRPVKLDFMFAPWDARCNGLQFFRSAAFVIFGALDEIKGDHRLKTIGAMGLNVETDYISAPQAGEQLALPPT